MQPTPVKIATDYELLRLEVEVATHSSWKWQQTANECCNKLQTAVGNGKKLWLEDANAGNCGGKLQNTAVSNSNKPQMMEVATNYRIWSFHKLLSKRVFQNVSFQNVFFQNVFLLNVFCSRELQRTAVESYNTLQPGSAVGIWCKLRNEFATNWGWKLQQTSNGSCNNLRTAVGSFYENLRLEVAINCGWKLQQSYKLWMELATKH